MIGVTEAAEPYGTIAAAAVQITSQWKLYYALAKTNGALKAQTARVAVHLADAKRVVELGPVFVLDFGPNYDQGMLPKN